MPPPPSKKTRVARTRRSTASRSSGLGSSRQAILFLAFPSSMGNASLRYVSDNPFQDLGERQARPDGRRMKAGVRREAGIRVHFEDPGAVLFIHAEIDPRIPPEVEERPASQGKLRQAREEPGVRFRKIERARCMVEFEGILLPLGA